MVFNKIKIFIIAIIIIILLIGSYFLGHMMAVSSEPYKVALSFINESPKVKNQIGQVIDAKLEFWGYSVRYNSPHGNAKFAIELKAEKGQGTVFIDLERKAGIWEIIAANLKLDNGKIIGLTIPSP